MTTTQEAVLTRPRLGDEGRALLFTEARTANAFSSRPVSDAELSEIWDLAKWPPTAANVQPLRVLYVRSEAGKQRLLPLMNEGNRDKTASAPVTAILAVDTAFHEYIPHVMPIKAELKDFFEANEGPRDNMGRFSAGLQMGYFLLAVRANGLVAGPMGGFDQAGVDAEFFPDGRFKSLLVVNIGHAADGAYHPRLPRLDHDTTVSWA